MWNVGIIGAGSYGEQHARAIATLDNLQVVAASRTSADALQAFTDRYGGTAYTDYRDLLNDKDVQVVVIATPHHLHTEITLAAIKAGKHILLEKPLAATMPDCERIGAAVRASEITFMVGHVNHFVPAYRVAREMLKSGEMGRVVHGLSTMQKYWMVENRRNWHLDPGTGGGVWLTVGIHPLERLSWLIDSPITTVSAQFGTHFHAQKADDSGMVFMRYDNGAAGTIVSTGYQTGVPKHLSELTCTKGMMNIDYESGVSIGRDENWQTIPESLPSENWMHDALVEEWRQFIQAVEQNTPPPVATDFVLHIMEVMFAALRSSEMQQEIKIRSSWGT